LDYQFKKDEIIRACDMHGWEVLVGTPKKRDQLEEVGVDERYY
jgi:hypothetical protein